MLPYSISHTSCSLVCPRRVTFPVGPVVSEHWQRAAFASRTTVTVPSKASRPGHFHIPTDEPQSMAIISSRHRKEQSTREAKTWGAESQKRSPHRQSHPSQFGRPCRSSAPSPSRRPFRFTPPSRLFFFAPFCFKNSSRLCHPAGRSGLRRLLRADQLAPAVAVPTALAASSVLCPLKERDSQDIPTDTTLPPHERPTHRERSNTLEVFFSQNTLVSHPQEFSRVLHRASRQTKRRRRVSPSTPAPALFKIH